MVRFPNGCFLVSSCFISQVGGFLPFQGRLASDENLLFKDCWQRLNHQLPLEKSRWKTGRSKIMWLSEFLILLLLLLFFFFVSCYPAPETNSSHLKNGWLES